LRRLFEKRFIDGATRFELSYKYVLDRSKLDCHAAAENQRKKEHHGFTIRIVAFIATGG